MKQTQRVVSLHFTSRQSAGGRGDHLQHTSLNLVWVLLCFLAPVLMTNRPTN